MRTDNIAMLQDTMKTTDRGYYFHNGSRVDLKLDKKQMQEIEVYLPEEVHSIWEGISYSVLPPVTRTEITCENMDSYSMAIKRTQRSDAKKPVLVLNFANPVNPGGGVRRGASAQEEDLCRKSTLLLSLESSEAERYYRYNKSLNTYMGSDAIMITPQVEIIKNEKGEPLSDSVIVAVMTCAAPMITHGIEGMTEAQYRDMLYERIRGILKIAAYEGYSRLVLGAFGCGAFSNDAHLVSDLFYQAISEFSEAGFTLDHCFDSIDFAVLSRSSTQYNFREFSRNFGDYYGHVTADEPQIDTKADTKVITKADTKVITKADTQVDAEMNEDEKRRDRIRGSLIGGAAGDALGYAVEFSREDGIFARYGEQGITEYELVGGTAQISDDTQMTLFTANGILVGETRVRMRGIGGDPRGYVPRAYEDWLQTQQSAYRISSRNRADKGCFESISWLMDVPELYARRAPGNTCLSALEQRRNSQNQGGIRERAANNSKGCGGVMRTAPVALHYRCGENCSINLKELDEIAADLAAVTHGHSLGYMPSAVINHVIYRILEVGEESKKPGVLESIIMEAKDAVEEIYAGDKHLTELTDMIQRAVRLSQNRRPDLENIHELGKGWVAEETMGIALYCALRYRTDFSQAIIAAANHNGDSDSTAAVTGNIVGAIVGCEAMEEKWKQNLELQDVILEMADDLAQGCLMSEYGDYHDPAWETKYISVSRYEKTAQNAAQNMSDSGYTFFWKDNEKNGEFSNWYRCDFVIDDFKYFCVEQYMMAQKAKLFHDADHYTAILRANSPSGCKHLGKQVTPFDADRWNEVKYDVVKKANHAKYTQNPELLEKLLATGNTILAEASPKDKIWGIGLDAAEAQTTRPENWPGESLLGQILMELREEFRV